MVQNYQQFFTILVNIYFLSIPLITAAKVTVTIGRPYATESTAKFLLYGVEDFDTVTTKYHYTYDSNFNSSGYGSTIQGTYNDAPTGSQIKGRYTGLEVAKNDKDGGVGPEGVNYQNLWHNCDLKLTSYPDYGINYFGFHGESLNVGNRIEFYLDDEMIFELKLDDIITKTTLMARPENEFPRRYLYNPNLEFEEDQPQKKEPFVFVNVFFEDIMFNLIKFRTRYGTFEMDIHTLGYYLKTDGNNVPLSTSYKPPKKKIPEKKPITIPAPSPWRVFYVHVEPPGQTDTSALFEWSAREDFTEINKGIHENSYKSEFYPSGMVQGTYSAPFDVLQNPLKTESYFSTSDSLLNLTLSENKKKPNFFGLYLSPLNRKGSLEFFLKGQRILIFYLADVFDYIENNLGYLGNPLYSQAGDKANTERFVFINILFINLTFDAIRIRNWKGGNGGDVMSDNHRIGHYYYHPIKKYVNSTRTTLKLNGPTPKLQKD